MPSSPQGIAVAAMDDDDEEDDEDDDDEYDAPFEHGRDGPTSLAERRAGSMAKARDARKGRQ